MAEMKSLTLNDKTYDGFVDPVARAMGMINSASGESITVSDSNGTQLFGLRIFGKTTQDGTPTPDAPVDLVSAGDSGNVSTEVCGKNLLNIKSATVDGFTITNNGGNIIINGTNKNSYVMRLKLCSVQVCAGMMYCLNGGLSSDNALIVSKTIDTFDIQSEGTFGNYTATEDTTMGVYLRIKAGQTLNNYIICPQLEIGSVATEYEPYKSQTLTISTPNGLPGIPVASGGNYTDANGQQWICDEIDFWRGVRVQRVYRKKFTNADGMKRVESGFGYRFAYATPPLVQSDKTNGVRSLCDSLPLAWYGGTYSTPNCYTVNGVEIMIALAGNETLDELADYFADKPIEVQGVFVEPIETPLTEEELAAYAALYTYKGNTTVSNDAGAWMDLEYVMDAKKYIDSLVASGGGTIIPATVE